MIQCFIIKARSQEFCQPSCILIGGWGGGVVARITYIIPSPHQAKQCVQRIHNPIWFSGNGIMQNSCTLLYNSHKAEELWDQGVLYDLWHAVKRLRCCSTCSALVWPELNDSTGAESLKYLTQEILRLTKHFPFAMYYLISDKYITNTLVWIPGSFFPSPPGAQIPNP